MILETASLEKTVLIKNVKKRLYEENKNWIAAITGPTGSGKSYSALRLAELLDPGFSLDQVVLKAMDFLDLIRNGIKNGDGAYTPLKKGSIIIWDEAGTGIGNRQWYTVQNQMMDFLTQTFRYRNLGVIYTLPTLKMLDYHQRCLLHCYMQCVGVDLKEEKSLVKVYEIEYSDWSDKIYRHLLIQEGKKISMWELGLPEHIKIKEYEDKKDKFANELYTKIYKTLSNMGVSKAKQAEEMLRLGSDSLHIADELDMPVSTVQRYETALKRYAVISERE